MSGLFIGLRVTPRLQSHLATELSIKSASKYHFNLAMLELNTQWSEIQKINVSLTSQLFIQSSEQWLSLSFWTQFLTIPNPCSSKQVNLLYVPLIIWLVSMSMSFPHPISPSKIHLNSSLQLSLNNFKVWFKTQKSLFQSNTPSTHHQSTWYHKTSSFSKMFSKPLSIGNPD